MTAPIAATGLRKLYGETVGIDGVDLTVAEGDIVGFIGPNGAGKSTTIRVLLGLLKPTDGRATILGSASWRLPAEVLQRVGYLPSSVRYYDRMAVGAFLSATARFYDVDCSRRIAELCERLDVDTRRRFGDLSLGNRKKVGVVQCFMHSPRLVILDEPTSGLDPLIQARFFELLEEENRRGVTVLLSSHTLSEVQRHCRTVAIIRRGKIVETGDVSTIRGRQYRRVELTADDATLDAAARLESVRVERRSGQTGTYLVGGPMSRFLAGIDVSRVRDVLIEEPSLEEVFMHYYAEDEE